MNPRYLKALWIVFTLLCVMIFSVYVKHKFFDNHQTTHDSEQKEKQEIKHWGVTATRFFIADNATKQPLLLVIGTKQTSYNTTKTTPKEHTNKHAVVASFYDAMTGQLVKETPLGYTRTFDLQPAAQNIAGQVFVILKHFEDDSQSHDIYRLNKTHLNIHKLPPIELAGLSERATKAVHIHFANDFNTKTPVLLSNTKQTHTETKQQKEHSTSTQAIQFTLDSNDNQARVIYYFPALKKSFSHSALNEIYPYRSATTQDALIPDTAESTSPSNLYTSVYSFAQSADEKSNRLIRYEQTIQNSTPRKQPYFMLDFLVNSNHHQQHDGIKKWSFVNDKRYHKRASVLSADEDKILILHQTQANHYHIEKLSAQTGKTLWKISIEGDALDVNSSAMFQQHKWFVHLLRKQVVIEDQGTQAKLLREFYY